MQIRKIPLITVLLVTTLVFALVIAADAGAVRRGDRSSSSGGSRSGGSSSGSSRSYRPAPSQRSSSGESGRSRSYRSEPSKRSSPGDSSRSRSYRPSDSYRPSGSSHSTMKDRTIDARPSYRPSGGSYRDHDSGRSHDYYRSRTGDRDYSKFYRPGERIRTDYPRSYRPPRYYGGYYHYYDGWPSSYDFRCRYGYWLFDYDRDYSARSIYYHYGYFPYIPFTRVVVVRRPVVTYVETPLVIREYGRDESYYLEDGRYDSIDRALDNIRSAWTRRDADRLLRHVRGDVRVDVLLDGDYSYSVDGDDYRDMSRDAVASTETSEFEFYSVRSRGEDRVVAYAVHKFFTRRGERKTVYVSYLLERRGGEWIITEVGSSLNKLDH
ncbi:MAG: hypothetical protein HYX78_03575 [Armatimonadetes bacterium]|nr:hypothetical protein [Armatimonadota bacterium]